MPRSHRIRLFDSIQPDPVSTSTGQCNVPILYHDGSLLVIGYRIDPKLAGTVLDSKALEPFVMFGKAIVLLCIFEYRSTTIGPYHEIGVGLYAKRTGTSPSLFGFLGNLRKCEDIGLYVASLPVSTQASLVAGTELWGFPKYVADIKTAFGPNGVEVTLGNEFVLTHSKGRGLVTAGPPFITYTFLGGHLLRTIVEVGHRVRFGGARTTRLKLVGPGPTADVMATLGLDRNEATFAFRTDSLSAVLPLGKDLGPA